MQVDSIGYLFLFLPLAALAVLGSPRGSRIWVLNLANLAFYIIVDPLHLPVVLGFVALNFVFARRMSGSAGEREKNITFWIGVVFNIGLLVGYKSLAAGFFGSPRSLGGSSDFAALLRAPLGISYIVFQLVGCLTDLRGGQYSGSIKFGEFAAFSLFFSQISSGPISRAEGFFPQLQNLTTPQPATLEAGFRLILYGIFKKLVLANNIERIVAYYFDDPVNCTRGELLIATLLNPVQLYADFSGYTDIARGGAMLLGIDLPLNFNRPYLATSVGDFWRRWHMSLSSWLRDYLYNPLVFQFRQFGFAAICGSLLITFVAVGVWHDFALHYAVFGLLHGLLLCGETLTRRWRTRTFKTWSPTLVGLAGWAYTMVAFTLSQIFFRSPSMIIAQRVAGGVLGFPRLDHYPSTIDVRTFLVPCLLGFCAWVWIQRDVRYKPRPVVSWSNLLIITVVLIVGRLNDKPFIYAQF